MANSHEKQGDILAWGLSARAPSSLGKQSGDILTTSSRRIHVRNQKPAKRAHEKGFSQGNGRCGRRAGPCGSCRHDHGRQLARTDAGACRAGGAGGVYVPLSPLPVQLPSEVHGSRWAHGFGRTERMARQTQRNHLPEGHFRDSAYVQQRAPAGSAQARGRAWCGRVRRDHLGRGA